MAKELAALTGESLTEAVTVALEERLARARLAHARGLAERLLAIGRDCAGRLREPYASAGLGDLLHDEAGLPR